MSTGIVPSFVLQLSSRFSSFCLTPHLTNRIRHVPSADRRRATPCIVNLAIAQGPAAAFRFGASLESRLAATRGSQLLGVCLTNQSLFVFSPVLSSSLLHPFFAFSFFVSCFRSLARSLPTSNHHLFSVSPAASALHRLSPGIA